MALSFNVTPGYSFSASEKVTYPKLNLLGSPVIQLDGQASSAQIADGSITTAKLASTIDINSKIADHNIDLDKLASGTHGQILYYDSNENLVTLAPGTSGKFLKTQGPGNDPVWEAQAGVGTITVDQIGAGGANQYLVTNSAGTEAEWATRSSSGQWTALDDPYYIVMQRVGGAWVRSAGTVSGSLSSTPTVTDDATQTAADYTTNYDGEYTDYATESGLETCVGFTGSAGGAIHANQSRIDENIAIGTFTSMLSSLTSFNDFTAVMATVQLTSSNAQGAGAFYQLGSQYIPLAWITDPSGTGANSAGSHVIPVASSCSIRLTVGSTGTINNDVSNAYIKLTHVQLA